MRLVPPDPVRDDAEFSFDKLCRYWLSRRVAETGPVGLFVGLNPSIADAENPDHTVAKWCGFATRWGWSGFWVANLFPCVETKSKKLATMKIDAQWSALNDKVLRAMFETRVHVVMCWGNNIPRNLRRRERDVMDLFRQIQPLGTAKCFGVSGSGHPLHPLRLGYDTPLVPLRITERVSRRDEE